MYRNAPSVAEHWASVATARCNPPRSSGIRDLEELASVRTVVTLVLFIELAGLALSASARVLRLLKQ